MKLLLALSTIIPIALALIELPTADMTSLNRRLSPRLEPRQSSSNYTSSGCESNESICGSMYCIPETYTCCPDRKGGCSPSTTCSLGDDGDYGCCPAGKTCSGDGGTTTYDDADDLPETDKDDDKGSNSGSGGSSSGSGGSSGASTGAARRGSVNLGRLLEGVAEAAVGAYILV